MKLALDDIKRIVLIEKAQKPLIDELEMQLAKKQSLIETMKSQSEKQISLISEQKAIIARLRKEISEITDLAIKIKAQSPQYVLVSDIYSYGKSIYSTGKTHYYIY